MTQRKGYIQFSLFTLPDLLEKNTPPPHPSNIFPFVRFNIQIFKHVHRRKSQHGTGNFLGMQYKTHMVSGQWMAAYSHVQKTKSQPSPPSQIKTLRIKFSEWPQRDYPKLYACVLGVNFWQPCSVHPKILTCAHSCCFESAPSGLLGAQSLSHSKLQFWEQS